LNQLKTPILTLISGVLFSLCWNSIVPCVSLFVAFVPLLFLLENKQFAAVRIFHLSFIILMIFHLGTVWWLIKSSIFGFFMIIVSNSLYLSLGITLTYMIRRSYGIVTGCFSFICLWLTFEYIHYSWELSWPFMNLGNWLAQKHQWIQWYEYTGVLGGTLWILIVNLTVYLILRNIRNWRSAKMAILFCFCILIIILPILFSLQLYSNYSEKGGSLTFKIIQPNINPYSEKYSPKLFGKQIDMQIKLAKSGNTSSVDCYLFPESSFPVYLNEDSLDSVAFTKKIFKELVDRERVALLGGFYSFRIEERDSLFYNTAFFIRKGKSMKTRHKSKLVVGVEKMPFQDYLAFLKSWNLDLGGYNNSLTIDDETPVYKLASKSYSIAPIICYESIYGQYVSEFVKNGASSIAVITNDAWWGDSPGYSQHLMHSRLRAIENRRNVVRAANTGTSCIINGRGDIVQKIRPFTQNSLTGRVNQDTRLSFYSIHGDFIGRIALWCSMIILLSYLIRNYILKYKKQSNVF
jgi:apolipoprotein N-acyltransferase